MEIYLETQFLGENEVPKRMKYKEDFEGVDRKKD